MNSYKGTRASGCFQPVLLLAAALSLLVPSVDAATRSMVGSDASGTSSFNSGLHWDDGLAPTNGNDYVNPGLLLRTPQDGNSYTFAGDTLTLSNHATMALKGTSSTCVYTMGTNAATGMSLNDGWIGMWNGNALGVAGFITLGPNGGGLDPQANAPLNISAQISGAGFLIVDSASPTGPTGGRTVLSASNTYTGGTIIDANMTLQLAGAGTLGSTGAPLQIINTNNNRGHGKLDLNGTSQAVGSLSGTGGQIYNNTVGTTNTLTIGTGNTGGGEFAGAITSGNGVLGLAKVGSATISLSGVNTYTGGTTISGGTLQVARISGVLAGSGNLVLMLAPTNSPQQITGSNGFSGQITVMAGWLRGAGDGSLGTNSVTVDPFYSYDLSFQGTPVYGPAVFEPNYHLNSAGSLTLVNGGMVMLHQNCAFTSVTIEGVPLSAGTHYYSELIANFPGNFLPGGSGAITVQPYGTLPAIGPVILAQPQPTARYTGLSVSLSVAATGDGALSYQWRKSGVNLGDAGNVSGATTSNLLVSNVSAGDDADYDVIVSNVNGATTSQVAHLTVVVPEDVVGSSVLDESPTAFYRFNDSGDTFSGTAVAYDYAGGYDGVYGDLVLNGLYGISGPLPSDGYTGFGNPNGAALFSHSPTYTNSRVVVKPWNLNTNEVTIAAWLKPDGAQNEFNGVVFSRGAGTIAGLNYTGYTNSAGNYTLGYTWNNDGNTFFWNSGIAPQPGEWSFVALVVTPTNASVHIVSTNGMLTSTRTYNHPVQSFGGTTVIGSDSFSYGARAFNGSIDDVAVFARALSGGEIVELFYDATGISNFAPAIVSQPASQTLYEQQTAEFAVIASGSAPLSYRWQSGTGGTYTNLSDGGRISGSATPNLVISNLVLADAMDYVCIVTNSQGVVTSGVAVLTVQPVSAAETITMSVVESSGQSWETGANWSDGLPASVSSVSKPGSTYRILPGGGMRTPDGAVNAIFPGVELTVEGDGNFMANVAGTGVGAVILKTSNGGRVDFPKLIMAGGEILSFVNSGGSAVIGGELNVISNAPIHAPDDTSTRSIRIDAKLTGNGNVEYRGYPGTAFRTNAIASLNIAGTNNTFTGTWNVMLGTIVGSATNSLGTNSIVIGAGGALQAAYSLHSSNATLFVNGRLNLTGAHTFKTAFVNGVALSAGTYTASQLAAAYPNHFPTNWVGQPGAENLTNAFGTLTVLASAGPVILTQPSSLTRYEQQTASFGVVAASDQTLFYQWKKFTNSAYANVVNGGRVSGATSTNLVITNLAVADAGNYVVVVSNSLGVVTSSVATLTVNSVSPAENITMSVVQSSGQTWDTGSSWSDGLAASLSAVSKPGSSYFILPGGGMRTPNIGSVTQFPGNILTLSGDGVYSGTLPASGGALMLKGTTSSYKKLVLGGGQILSFTDSNNGHTLAGEEINVVSNAPIAGQTTSSGRSITLSAKLTGGGTIEYRGFNNTTFQASFVTALNVAGTNNTFTGQWNVLGGTLVGSTSGSLGTNTISVASNAAVQASYDISNPNSTLILNGRMNLTRNHTFGSVIVNGTNLAPGTYSFAQLSAAYPSNFPSTWTGQTGATGETSASGSISIPGGTASYPTNLSSSFTGGTLSLSWPATHLGWILQRQTNSIGVGLSTNWADISGTASITSTNISVNTTAPAVFYRLRHP